MPRNRVATIQCGRMAWPREVLRLRSRTSHP